MPRMIIGNPPPGWEEIEPTLGEMERRMRDIENDTSEGKRATEALWPIFQLHHQRSRYIYELYAKGKIDKDLYDFCIKHRMADAALIAKWKKPGYERLCCLRCIQTKDTNFGTCCICRVPRNRLNDPKPISCVHCGCRGC